MQTPATSSIVFPPSSLTELRRVPAALQRGELTLTMGKRSFHALCTLLDEPTLAATHNIVELAGQLNISAASLTRLARLLGYSGFGAFQAIFRDAVSKPRHYYSEQAKAMAAPEAVSSTALLLDDQLKAVQRLRTTVSENELDAAVELLVKARRIRVAGRRQSHSLATLCAYMLGLIRDGVSVVGASGEGQAQALTDMTERDLLVVFGSEPYSRDTIKLVQVAHRMGLPVLAFTDHSHSPLSQWALQAVRVPSQGKLYTNSLVATLLVVETVLIQVAQRLGKKGIARLEKREAVIGWLNDEY
ncbi:MurR/RpiR family transcriptional regulator [Salinispirillum sp. LH 10-3-1]|uniref:MurR/RpiR family transcriptional regulator n=1 Tax=Salinispirillum sp. LH 10-3-1 TaxID=2952525 RepID=A0AB38YKP2_9GAMM